MSKEKKSIISTIFTDAQLKKLNFTPEEIEAIEDAEAISQMIDILPDEEKDMDAFYAKLAQTFPLNIGFEETYKRFADLSFSDPKFFEQIIAMSLLLDTIEDVPQASAQKVSLAEIAKEKKSQSTAEKQAKMKRVDDAIKAIAANAVVSKKK